MPLERKIMLGILSALILFFGIWFYYSEVIVPNRTVVDKISRIEDYIIKWNSIEEENIPEDFEEILNRSEELNSFFTTQETFSMDQFAGNIRSVLTKNSITINQFRTGSNSVTFYISGKRDKTLKAIWELSNNKPLYIFETLQLRVNSDRQLQGVITLSPLFYPIESNPKYIRESIRGENFRGTYRYNLQEIWGEPLIIEKEKEEEVIPEVVTPTIYKTDKFTYIGTMKAKKGTTYMFRETINGRVFIYSLGETISQWTLQEIQKGRFIFKNQEKLYEVSD